MSDQSKYINTYIDTVMAVLHEQLGNGLQLKTQLKLLNDLLQEKDGVIAHLSNELEKSKNNQNNINSIQTELILYQDKLRISEENLNALRVKVSHMDTLTKQLTDMKNEIRIRDESIAALTKKLDTGKANTKPDKTKSVNSKVVKDLPTSKVEINTKSKLKELSVDDDF